MADPAMDSKRWQLVDQLLQAALEHSPDERAGFLRRACAGDDAMEREVHALLASHQAAGSFLESPAMEVAAQALALEQDQALAETAGVLAGRTISHYRIVGK